MARVRLLLSAPAAAEVAVGSGAALAEASMRLKDGVRLSTGGLHPEGKRSVRVGAPAEGKEVVARPGPLYEMR